MSADHMRDQSLAAFDRAYLLALDDHNQGAVKDIGEYLRLVPADEQAELATLIAATLTPRSPAGASADALAEGYERAMSVIGAIEASAGPTGVLPGALESMSRARGIEPDHIVAELAAEFDITSDDGLATLRRYYHRMRSGQLLGSRIAHRLLAALARIFDAEPEDFIAAVRPIGTAPLLSAAPAMPRPAGDTRSTAIRAEAEPQVSHPDDEFVKRLFCGGPDA
jgi:hypothetical protein